MQLAAAGTVGGTGAGGADRLVDSARHMRPVQDAHRVGKVLGGLRLDPFGSIPQDELVAGRIPV
jgi:hypothetical protein